MRRRAYLEALEEAAKLPEQLSTYGSPLTSYNPRLMAIESLKTVARNDSALFNCELLDVLKWEPSDASNLEDLADKFVVQATEQLNRSRKPSKSSGSKGNEEV